MGELNHYLRYVQTWNGVVSELIREKRDIAGRRYNTYAFCKAVDEDIFLVSQKRISLNLTESMLHDDNGVWDKTTFNDDDK